MIMEGKVNSAFGPDSNSPAIYKRSKKVSTTYNHNLLHIVLLGIRAFGILASTFSHNASDPTFPWSGS